MRLAATLTALALAAGCAACSRDLELGVLHGTGGSTSSSTGVPPGSGGASSSSASSSSSSASSSASSSSSSSSASSSSASSSSASSSSASSSSASSSSASSSSASSSSSSSGSPSTSSGATLLGCQVVSGVEQLAQLPLGPAVLFVVADNDAAVYWVQQDIAGTSSHLYRIPLDCGATPIQVWDLGVTTIGGIASASGAVYLTRSNPGGILRVPFGGSVETFLTTGIDLAGIAVDPTDVHTAYVTATTAGKVLKVDLDAATTTDFAVGEDHPTEVSAAILPYSVLWIDAPGGNVRREMLSAGATPTTPGAGQASPRNLHGLTLGAMWVTPASAPGAVDGAIVQLGISDTFSHVLVAGLPGPVDVAASPTDVFWTDSVQQAIQRRPISGGAPVMVAGGLGAPGPLARSGTTLYFVDTATWTLDRVAAP